jgi:hypothetical protein
MTQTQSFRFPIIIIYWAKKKSSHRICWSLKIVYFEGTQRWQMRSMIFFCFFGQWIRDKDYLASNNWPFVRWKGNTCSSPSPRPPTPFSNKNIKKKYSFLHPSTFIFVFSIYLIICILFNSISKNLIKWRYWIIQLIFNSICPPLSFRAKNMQELIEIHIHPCDAIIHIQIFRQSIHPCFISLLLIYW